MTSSKSYKLFANPGDGSRPPCAFFLSEQGCRNGDQCKFSHDSVKSAGNQDSAAAPQRKGGSTDVGSVVSSESSVSREKEDKDSDFPFTMNQPASNGGHPIGDKKKDSKKNRRAKHSDDPFANPNKKPKTNASGPNPPETLPKSGAAPSRNQKKKQNKAGKPATTSPDATQPSDFRSLVLNLPVAAFSLPTETESKSAKPEGKKIEEPKVQAEPVFQGCSLPVPSAAGQAWVDAVAKTRVHPRYKESFNFDKFKRIDEDAGYGTNAWVKAKPFGDWCKNSPQVIAIDCEMCETQDPVSGARDARALCRISVVDAKDGSVLLDSLVKPSWPVIDYRTWINGIAKKQLENVEFTLRHAQAFMMALCSEETVIAGHAVHNDLAAIRMEHHCNVDSACLYSAKDSPTASVGLKDLSASLLKKDMPNKHDSVNDARTALECVNYFIAKDGKVDAIERAERGKTIADYGCLLFVHRIPKFCDRSHLEQMFAKHAFVLPSEVDEIQFAGANGKAVVRFRSVQHANLAFNSLGGKPEVEASGRLQKKVFLRDGGYVRVRKMAFEKDRSGRPNDANPSTKNETV